MGTGRPKAEINWAQVDEYLRAGCDGVSIAAFIGISPLTLYRAVEREHNVNFDSYRQLKRAEGDDLILYTQYKMAIKDNDKAMLIWLGKQRLGQSEKTDVKHEQPLTIEMHVSQATADAIADLQKG